MIVTILIIAIAIMIAYTDDKKFTNLMSVFGIFWGLIICLSKARLFGMIEISEKAYLIVYVGVCSFAIGYVLHTIYKNQGYRLVVLRRFRHKKNNTYCFNWKIILLFEAVLLLFELMISLRVMGILFGGSGFALIHDMAGGYSETTLLISSFERYVDTLFVMPVIFAVIPICTLLIFERSPKKGLIICLGLIDLVLYILVHGGRVVIIYVLVYLILLYRIYGIKMSKRFKRRIKQLLLLGGCAIVFLTIARKGLSFDSEGIIDSLFSGFYQYLTVSMPLLDHWINVIDEGKTYTYGMSILHGILNFPFRFLNKAGIYFPLLTKATLAVEATEETFVYNLYNRGMFNAFVTMFYFFYLDFRWIGVTICSIAYGAFCHMCEFLGKKGNLYRTAMYLLIAQSVIKSFGRWEFYLEPYCLAFIFLRLCFIKTNPYKVKRMEDYQR